MFNINDVWNVLNSLQGKTVSGLDPSLQIISQAEKVKATSLFTNTIDQIAFDSNDYQRLRNMLIDWYSTFRTFTSIQQQVSDPYALTSNQLNELMLSFGYSYGLNILSKKSRINFFLDLVNLYKIKGTPLSLQKALGYYGLHDTDIAEYWLLKNSNGELVFRGTPIFPGGSNTGWDDLDFDLTIANDPHWIMTKEQILAASANNPISFPSRSPYFGIRSVFDFGKIEVLMAWFYKLLYNQYIQFQTNQTLIQDIVLSNINIKVSLLECYLACVYTFNLNFNHIGTSNNPSILLYNGNSTTSTLALNEYNNIINPRPLNQLDRDIKLQELYNLFTNSSSYDFIPQQINVANLLDSINLITKNNLRASLDTWLSSTKQVDLLSSLFQDLSGWTTLNIDDIFPDIFSNIIGISSYINIVEIVNIFKPYRSRVIASQYAYIINNHVYDIFLVEDGNFSLKPIEIHMDYATADSFPCHELLDNSDSKYSRDTFDCGSNFDIGIFDDQNDFANIVEQDFIYDKVNYHTNEDFIDTEYTDSTGIIDYIISTGGMNCFDSGFVFDDPFISDIVQIYVLGIGGTYLDINAVLDSGATIQ
jgi:hypothetical protein